MACSVKWIGLHWRNPWDPGRVASPGLDSLAGTESGISRGGRLDSLGSGVSCSLGVRNLLTSVLQARTPGRPCAPGAAGTRIPLCRSLWASRQLSSAPSLPSFYQLPRHLHQFPSRADWGNLSHPSIHPPSSCIYCGRSANTELCARHEHFPRCELDPQKLGLCLREQAGIVSSHVGVKCRAPSPGTCLCSWYCCCGCAMNKDTQDIVLRQMKLKPT